MTDKRTSFPVYTDEDASPNLLFRFICNNLYFGQWELARACIDTLRTDVAAKEQTAAVLLDCAKGSVWPGCRSDGVPNSQALAWLALKEYEQLSQRDTLVENLERALELRLLLIAVSNVITPTYASELCELTDIDSSHGNGAALSAQCLELMQKLLRQQPSYGVRLLQLVFGESGSDPRFEETVLAALDGVLDDLCVCPAEDVRQIESLNKTCYDMLAALGTASCRRVSSGGGSGVRMSQQQQQLASQNAARRQVFQRIVDLMANENRLVLTTGAVYGALLSSSCCDVLRCFCEVEDGCLTCLSSGLSPSSNRPVSNTSYKSHIQFVHWRTKVKNTLALQQDFLTATLECCQCMAVEKRYSELGKLVDAAEMSMLAPMVLQTAWQYTAGCSDDCRSLLATFAQLEHRSEALNTLLEQLSFYADVTDWCTKLPRHAEASAAVESSTGQPSACSSRDETRMRSILLGALQSGSLLHALSACVGLKTVDENDVRHHLRNGPVRHAVKEKASDAERHRQHQLSLFDAFCSVRRFAEIILHGSRHTQSDLEAMAETARNALLQIRPVTLRLEAVEDVFALLFACHTDVTDGDHGLLHGKSSDESDKESDTLKDPSVSTNAISAKASSDADRSRRSRQNDTSTSDDDDDQLSPHASTASSTGAGGGATGSAGRVTSSVRFASGTVTDEQLGGRQLLQPGFLASAAVVKCILHALMRAVTGICAEHRVGCVDQDIEDQNDLSTVAWDDYERRLSRVQQYLNEAWWRFQIAVDVQPISGVCGSNASDDASYNSDDELSRYASSKPSDRPGKDATSHSMAESKRPRRHGRPDRSTARCHGSIVRPQALWKESAVSLMLAQPAAMVARCLTRGQAVRAKKVVETCMAADSSLSREVAFGDRYATALQRLWSAGSAAIPGKQGIDIDLLGLRHGGSLASIMPLTSGGSYSLGFLGDLAASGAAAASSFAVADELLSSGVLPDMAIDWSAAGKGSPSSAASAASKSVGNVDEGFRFHLNNALVASCVLLDLASVGCRDAEQCCRFLASALERLPTGTVSRNEDSSELLGSLGFLRRCYSLMASSDQSVTARFALGVKPQQSTQPSLSDLLLGLMAPFDADALRVFLTTAVELEQCENQLDKTISGSGGSDGSAASEHLERRPATVPSGKMMLSPPSTVYLNLAVEQASRAVTAFRAAFKSFACCVAGQQNGSVKTNAEENQHVSSGATFLLCMFNHCKALRGLMDVQASRDRERIADTNCFAILKQSPTLIMGRLIFERGVSPLRLEPEARKLQLDLTHIIVRSCCRPVPCKVSPSTQQEILSRSRNTDLPLVLNQDGISYGGLTVESLVVPLPTKNALGLAEELLDEMMSAVQSALSRNADSFWGVLQVRSARHLHASSAEYAAAARATAKLGSVSLASLKSEDEKLCFFVNVLNLLYLHGLIHCLATQETPSEGKDSFIAYSSSLAYKVGELGVVSAFELEHFVIRCGMPSEFSRIKLSEYDPWQAFAPKMTNDWRITFLISRGTALSRPPKVVRPSELSSTLATEAALSIASSIRFTENRVEMAEELILYTQDISSDSIALHERPYATLLRRLCSAADTSTRQALEATLVTMESAAPPGLTGDLPAGNRVLFTGDGNAQEAAASSVAFVVAPCNFELGYAFDPALGPVQLSLTASFSAVSLASESGEADSRASFSVNRLTRCDSQLLQRQADFVLSDQAIQYLYDRSPVAGCIVDLLCLDRDASPFDVPASPSQPSAANVRGRPASMSAYLEMHVVPLLMAALAGSEAIPLASPDDGTSSAEVLDVAAKFPEMVDVIRATLLSRKSDPAAVLRKVVARLFEKRQFTSLLHLLNAVGMDTVWDTRRGLQYRRLKDYVLMRLACESYSRQSADYARQISNAGLQAHIILACLGSWPADICVDMLQLSEQRLQTGEAQQRGGATVAAAAAEPACCRAITLWPCLLRSVSAVLDEMRLYQQIIGHANHLLSDHNKSAKEKSDNEATSGAPSIQFLNSLTKGWQSVREAVHNETALVLQALYAAADFESAVKLARRHPGTHTEAACENYLIFLLTKDKPEFVLAEKLLESILSEDGDRCYAVSEGVLKRLRSQECILFVTRFLLNRLASRLGVVQLRKLRATNLGAKMLLQLADQARSQCTHLVSAPMLMLEQLLMNSQIEWAKTAVQVLRSSEDALPAGNDHTSSEGSQGLSMASAINELVERYAEKALDYPLVVTKDTVTGDSVSNVGQSRRVGFAGKGAAGSPVGVPASSSGLKSVPSSGTFSPTGTSVPKIDTLKRISSSIGLGAPSPGMISVSPLTSLPSSFSQTSGAAKKTFVIPDEPPSKDQWVDDAEASECMVCRVERFSMFNRRHHCRRCGRVVCSGCSSKTSLINGIVSRVCDECFIFMQEPKNVPPGLEKMKRIVERHSGNLGGGGSPCADSSPSASALLGGGEVAMTVYSLPEQQEWELTLDERKNQTIRDEFYYDFAPSTSLCVSLLDLHSDMRRSGQKMLQLCDSQLAKLLVPLKSGQENSEVDYSWVVSMMQFLVFNAKVRLAKCFDAEGQGSCDLYNSRVDILDLLVNANCRDIPAMQELTKMDSLRRLRDRLVEDERPTLAMEVSTKSGLDPSGAWAAWGFACLKSGDFLEARDKFSRCLKVPVDLNQQHQQSSKLVGDIVAAIESSQCASSANVQSLLSAVQDVRTLVAEPSVPPRSLFSDDVRMQECLYYLKTYGSHFALVEFYRKNGFLQKAVQYILDKECSPDVFVESLLMPSLSEGELGRLQDNLLMIDRTLEKWGPYLLAACRHLSRHNYIHVLYEVQLFMKDYIRAAMTCIRQLYLRGARTYADLYQRLTYLEKARNHLKAYLDPRQWGTVAKPPLGFAVTKLGSTGDAKTPPGSVVMVQSPDEVNRHINTVDLQIDVTKFMCRHEQPKEGVAAVPTVSSGKSVVTSPSGGDGDDRSDASIGGIPSLFGSSRMRADVVVAVMSASGNPNDSFGLAFRIVQDFLLDYAEICMRVARTFVARRNFTGVRQLLDCIRTSGLKGEGLHDEIVLTALRVIGSDEQQGKEIDNLIKLIRTDANRIEANIICGRLKSAYLVAVKAESADDVRRIAEAARTAGQTSVAAICEKWLKSRATR